MAGEDNPLVNAPHTQAQVTADGVDSPVLTAGRRLPGGLHAGPLYAAGLRQVLAAGRADRQAVRGSQPGLHLPAAGGIRVAAG